MIRFGWGFILGAAVGGVLALVMFGPVLCKQGIAGKVGGLLDLFNVPKDSAVRTITHDVLFN